MTNKYEHLMRPLKIGNLILQSRFLFPPAIPHMLQGPEPYPAAGYNAFYTGLARNKCALMAFNSHQLAENSHDGTNRSGNRASAGTHFALYDMSNPANENYVSQLCDSVHFHGGRLSVDVLGTPLRGYDVVATESYEEASIIAPQNGGDDVPPPMDFGAKEAFSEQQILDMIEMCAYNAKRYKSMGFDVAEVSVSARIYGSFLSASQNTRTDRWGGALLENRLRFPVECVKAIYQAVGDDMPIMLEIPDWETEGNRKGHGTTYEEVLALVKAVEPYIGLIHIRHGDTFDPPKCSDGKWYSLSFEHSKQLKADGITVPTSCWHGYQTFDQMEAVIASGACDMLTTGRLYLANPDFGKYLMEGRGDDLTPCVLCNRCRTNNQYGPWVDGCTVNPLLGMQHRVHEYPEYTSAPGPSRKVIIIGGGPAGMRAAIFASERGHCVTLCEKADKLGGQMEFVDYATFKWSYKRYRDWLVYQCYKRPNIDVRISYAPTPEDVKLGNYDVCIAATGATAKRPDIPGALDVRVLTPDQVYGNEKKIGKNVICIGGASTSSDTAYYLALQCEKNVTLLSRKKNYSYDSPHTYYQDDFRQAVRDLPNHNMTPICNARTVKIEDAHRVYYLDQEGVEHCLEADTVIVAGGVAPEQDAALAYYGCAAQFFVIGDCRQPNNITGATRTAYAAVMRIR